jgi:dihydrofolate reductase
MRKLIFGINLTIDGCCDHTKGIADEDVHNFFKELTLDSDTLLYGRKTYQLMVPFWPEVAKNNSGETKAMNDFAHAFASVKEIVLVSRSLSRVDEKSTTIIRGNLREEVLKLKQQEGKNILAGGVDVPTQLIQLGLVDEYYFVIQPVLVGDGRRLLENLTLQEKLQLVDSKAFRSGSIALRYTKSSS